MDFTGLVTLVYIYLSDLDRNSLKLILCQANEIHVKNFGKSMAKCRNCVNEKCSSLIIQHLKCLQFERNSKKS